MEQVNQFISKYTLQNVVQGNEEWYKTRKYYCGGSEIGTLIGVNPFTDKYSLILSKTNLLPQATFHVGDIVKSTRNFAQVKENDFLIVETEQSFDRVRVVKIGQKKQPLTTYFYISGNDIVFPTDEELTMLRSYGIDYPDVVANRLLELAGTNINSPSSDKLAMNWGILFEDVNQWVVEQMLDTKIYHTDCYIHNPNVHERVTYSPDGIGIYDDKITLFEFKCPFSRESNNEAPMETYIKQVQLGMEVIPIIEQGLLCRATIRLCDLTFQHIYSQLGQPKPLTSDYVAYGIICFYSSEDIDVEPVDIGSLHKLAISKLLSRLVRLSSTKYYNFMNGEEFIEPDWTNCYGYICWKVFDMNYDIIDKHEYGLINTYGDLIHEVLGVVDEINNETDYDKKLNIFNNYKNKHINTQYYDDDDMRILLSR